MMSDAVDPLKILEDTSPELEKTLEDPFSVNFRSKEEDIVELYPEHPSFRQANVDLANQNVELKMTVQKETEGYTTVIYGEGIALVESQVEVRIDDQAAISTGYYLITDEKTLMYDAGEWEQLYNPTPRDAALLTPELYQKAQKYTQKQEENTETDTNPVPPPEEGEFTE